jgi:hypothetical protein
MRCVVVGGWWAGMLSHTAYRTRRASMRKGDQFKHR